jgi:PST family polysaccharide transporter
MSATATEERPMSAEAVPVAAAEEARTDTSAPKGTYGQILKSSAMVGGSQMMNVAIGMVRTKAMAVMLGPAGFGLFGLYNSLVSLGQTLAGMGINSSGVRQIAAAWSTNDGDRIAETVIVLRRVALLLGLLGAGLMVVFARQISLATFANESHAGGVRWLSIAVLFTLISGAQTALIQGARRIADLAKMQVIGALLGTLCGLPLVFFLRERGVVPALICVAASTIITSWWYSRQVPVPKAARRTSSMAAAQVWSEAAALLKLGVAFMTSSLITLGVAYLIRVTVLRKIGFEATGLYQSAWTLGGLYVAFILQAMGADFYPRLTASADDNPTCNRLVNEQARVGLLLAGPGVIASLTFAPLVVALFYSAKFGMAVGMLRWICLGALLQVITWPMGFIIVAKAKRGLFISCEVAWGVVSVALGWTCIARFGLIGAGIAWFGSYMFHGVMLYAVVGRLSGFRWSGENVRTGLISLSLVAAAFAGFSFLPLAWSVAVGSVALLANTIYSVRILTTFIPAQQIPAPVRKMMTAVGLRPAVSVAEPS